MFYLVLEMLKFVFSNLFKTITKVIITRAPVDWLIGTISRDLTKSGISQEHLEVLKTLEICFLGNALVKLK